MGPLFSIGVLGGFFFVFPPRLDIGTFLSAATIGAHPGQPGSSSVSIVPPQVGHRPGRVGTVVTTVDRPHDRQYNRKVMATGVRSLARCSSGISTAGERLLFRRRPPHLKQIPPGSVAGLPQDWHKATEPTVSAVAGASSSITVSDLGTRKVGRPLTGYDPQDNGDRNKGPLFAYRWGTRLTRLHRPRRSRH